MYSKNYLTRKRSHHKQKVLLCQAPEKSDEHQRTATPPVHDAFVDNLDDGSADRRLAAGCDAVVGYFCRAVVVVVHTIDSRADALIGGVASARRGGAG
jgi:hypothetical protein